MLGPVLKMEERSANALVTHGRRVNRILDVYKFDVPPRAMTSGKRRRKGYGHGLPKRKKVESSSMRAAEAREVAKAK